MIAAPRPAWLLLADGSRWEGRAAAPGTGFGEVVFNTAMTGYQEVLTDPSYRGQIVVMTQPHIGNYGTAEGAEESARPQVEGFVARRFTATPEGGGEGLLGYLRGQRIPALEGIDTRAVVRRLREKGALMGAIAGPDADPDEVARELAARPGMEGQALALAAGSGEPWELAARGDERCHLVVLDCGSKRNILRSLAERGARLTVLPAGSTSAEVLAYRPDGVVISNGPGDPAPLTGPTAAVRGVVEAGTPTLGICLGHQLLALALGGRTYKLPFGHHGGNQPVKDLATGRVLVTSQNHGFAVDPDSLPAGARVSQVNLNDGTAEALEVAGRPVLSVQYHPEAAPGPHDATTVFDRFLELVAAERRG